MAYNETQDLPTLGHFQAHIKGSTHIPAQNKAGKGSIVVEMCESRKMWVNIVDKNSHTYDIGLILSNVEILGT